jgi:hypothetical protein
MRLVTVTPAGRRPYLEILANYLLRRHDLIAEHQWWLNTRVPEDVAYIYRLADRYPSFFRVIAKTVGPLDRGARARQGGGSLPQRQANHPPSPRDINANARPKIGERNQSPVW